MGQRAWAEERTQVMGTKQDRLFWVVANFEVWVVAHPVEDLPVLRGMAFTERLSDHAQNAYPRAI
jgi:hypothetical protein